ncbi:MAG TPA: L-threonylcarbamoyladenylate synthase [Bryobacteraceae bacterium]|nr:L-threonylcarbamoyladenylate synthase [Bryobacteraceae bacterium]
MAQTNFPTNEKLDHAAAILRAGGLVAFPTETVYGLGANALDPAAVAKIYAAKGRPASSPLIVHVSSVEMAMTVVDEWPQEAAALARQFWPGPLTLVMKKKPVIPAEVTAGLSTVGVRIPSHPVALQLIERAGVPVAAPSANRFTELSPTQAQHVRDGLGDRVDCILDGGPTDIGIESTVLSIIRGRLELLRPGMVTLRQIEAATGCRVSQSVLPSETAHASPGLHAKHYSPATKLIVSTELPVAKVAYLWWKNPLPADGSFRMSADPGVYARDLYAILHQLDGLDFDVIVVEPVPASEEWEGIRDRLKRASS